MKNNVPSLENIDLKQVMNAYSMLYKCEIPANEYILMK